MKNVRLDIWLWMHPICAKDMNLKRLGIQSEKYKFSYIKNRFLMSNIIKHTSYKLVIKRTNSKLNAQYLIEDIGRKSIKKV